MQSDSATGRGVGGKAGPVSEDQAKAVGVGAPGAVSESSAPEGRSLSEKAPSALRSLAEAADLGLFAAKLTRLLLERFGADLAEIWLLNPQGALSRQGAGARSGEPPPPDPLLGSRYHHTTEAVVGPLGATGQPFTAWSLANHVEHLLVHPVAVDGRPAGVLAVYSSRPIAADALSWTQLYASLLAVKLEDARLLGESRTTIAQLQLVLEASQVLNSTLDLAELLDLILNLACTEINAERGSVYLVDADKREIWTILAHGLEQQEIRLAFGQGVAGHVAETERTLTVEDAYSCPFFDRSFDERFNYRTRSLLCTPIRNRTGETVGILQLLNKREGPFTVKDEELLNALSIHMALALENARLHRELLGKQRLERELQLARTIQRSLLPERPPVIPGYDIAVLNEPCFEVGGDYYDFLSMGTDTLLVVVADVEGKGVSSAMIMSNLQATLRALVTHLHSLEVITLSLNEMILEDTHSEKFLSIFLGLMDTRRRSMHYINAGHIPPIVVRADGSVLTLTEGGMVIGLFSAVEYRRGSERLLPGDVMLFCTDGIIEASNAEHEEFGSERLADLVKAHQHLNAQELVQRIAQAVTDFSRAGSHIDDKVLMVVKVLEDLDPKV